MELQLTEKLKVEGVSKRYQEKDALRRVDFTVRDGEFLSILGPSGCGKSTLLRILIGLVPPDGGTVFKDGADITHLAPDKRGMGIVFQNYALFENMTVLRNVEYALRFRGIPKAQAREKAQQMLETVGLQEQMKKLPAGLSGGQQQRVAIARTLVLDPDVVLLDEPMSALDADTRLAMRAELKRLQDALGMTMIYVTHDQEEAFALSDRIMVMQQGEICQIDTPENIVRAPGSAFVQTFVLDNLQAKLDSLKSFTNGKRQG